MTRNTVKIPFPEFHPTVDTVSKSLYESGHFTDALRKASIRLEEECKKIYKEKTGNEESGTTLMAKLFCQKDGKVCMPMTNLSVKEGADRQKSIYFLFSGCMGAIRNPIAHESDDLEDVEALYGLNIVSYLFYKLGEVNKLKENNKKELVDKEMKDLGGKSLTAAKFGSIQGNIIAFALADNEINTLPIKTKDRENAKLLLKKRLDALLSDKAFEGEKGYDETVLVSYEEYDEFKYDDYIEFLNNKDFQEKIYNLILEKIYE